MAVDAVVFLRQHNMCCVTMQPHTTHLSCVLDNGPFKRLSSFLRVKVLAPFPPGTAVNDADVAGCVTRAWASTLTIVADPKTGAPTSPVISAIAKTGIFSFSRAPSTPTFSSSLLRTRPRRTRRAPPRPAAPSGPSRPSRPSSSPRTVPRSSRSRRASTRRSRRASPRRPAPRWPSFSRVGRLKRETEAASVRQAKEKRLEDGRAAKAAAQAARGGLSKAAYEKAQKDALAAAAAAAPSSLLLLLLLRRPRLRRSRPRPRPRRRPRRGSPRAPRTTHTRRSSRARAGRSAGAAPQRSE